MSADQAGVSPRRHPLPASRTLVLHVRFRERTESVSRELPYTAWNREGSSGSFHSPSLLRRSGLGQDDRVVVAWLMQAFRKGQPALRHFRLRTRSAPCELNSFA